MSEYIQGNLFTAEADILVNTLDCMGFMSKGIAWQRLMQSGWLDLSNQKMLSARG